MGGREGGVKGTKDLFSGWLGSPGPGVERGKKPQGALDSRGDRPRRKSWGF